MNELSELIVLYNSECIFKLSELGLSQDLEIKCLIFSELEILGNTSMSILNIDIDINMILLTSISRGKFITMVDKTY